ncbi:hypothetical protein [Paraherbaspirillum soli]|uniref:DUF721 domain-containing protein n=1 Tax=Paraherbaspirillum soli TaxID=631222 RepID=A0ABW0MBA1_9BURK
MAFENKAKRSLRHVVADLSALPIEEIEAIVAQLDAGERARLEPVLTEALQVSGKLNAAPASIPGAAQSAHLAADHPQKHVATLTALPDWLAARALAHLDNDVVDAVLQDELPVRQQQLQRSRAALKITPRAGALLFEIVIAGAVPAAPVKPSRAAGSRLLGRLFGDKR